MFGNHPLHHQFRLLSPVSFRSCPLGEHYRAALTEDESSLQKVAADFPVLLKIVVTWVSSWRSDLFPVLPSHPIFKWASLSLGAFSSRIPPEWLCLAGGINLNLTYCLRKAGCIFLQLLLDSVSTLHHIWFNSLFKASLSSAFPEREREPTYNLPAFATAFSKS